MLMPVKPVITVVFAILCFGLYAQSDYSIQFKSGIIQSSDGFEPLDLEYEQTNLGEIGGFFHLVLQFQANLTSENRKDLEGRGIVLYQYIPNFAYLAKVPIALDLGELSLKAVFSH